MWRDSFIWLKFIIPQNFLIYIWWLGAPIFPFSCNRYYNFDIILILLVQKEKSFLIISLLFLFIYFHFRISLEYYIFVDQRGIQNHFCFLHGKKRKEIDSSDFSFHFMISRMIMGYVPMYPRLTRPNLFYMGCYLLVAHTRMWDFIWIN